MFATTKPVTAGTTVVTKFKTNYNKTKDKNNRTSLVIEKRMSVERSKYLLYV